MKKGVGIIFLLIFIGCGMKTTAEKKKPTVTADTSSTSKPNKDYLKKRPEEFREFFHLSDVVPFMGKVATKKDVSAGIAVFNLAANGDTSHKALSIRLPFYAFLKQKNNVPPKFVAIMQAESLKGDTILGYKEATGLYGICKPRELEYFESSIGTVYSTTAK